MLRGGYNTRPPCQSCLAIPPIIALRGQAREIRIEVEPGVTRPKPFARDRHTCAYCGEVFGARHLEAEHIVPESRGGAWSWQNLTSACAGCNSRKRARTSEAAGMPLRFVPYVPSHHEDFILQGRYIRAYVHEWLASRLSRYSRLC